jgi:transcriptional regulator with XRE-family HTH domain
MRATEAELGIHAKTARQFLASVQNFSDRLKHALETSNKRKGALAEHCGVEASTVTRWLKGTQPMSEHILTMASFLGVDAKWLMGGDSLPCNVESFGEVKQGEVRDFTSVMREEGSSCRATVDPVAAAFAKIREGLDLLEQFMKNSQP